jgi:hypothetical protein
MMLVLPLGRLKKLKIRFLPRISALEKLIGNCVYQCRPSTPIRGVISNEFGEQAEEVLTYKYQAEADRKKESKKIDPPRHTKAS